ncbi:hypothetical protein [Kitasatospora sp. GP82]|uniref:hypothetical protein n=1 Tax=Kitasatospora sp. GP82 TaxID=3035089 RepID=UPI002474AD35|nr:hypothetical protein [Kitasatospora sp. GP82]MDH6125419.1 putative phage tail protein [Kitasatospora sp. GP82]
MMLLGLLLLGASGAFAALLIAYNLAGGPDYTVTLFGNDLATMNSLAVFCAGLALALIFCFGAALVMGGGILMRRRSRALRDARSTRSGRAPLGTGTGQDADTVGGTTPAAPPRHRHLFGH